MRKLYTLFTGLLFCLVILKTAGQASNNPQELFSGNTVSKQTIINSEISVSSELNGVASADTTTPVATCTADFEESPTPNSYLYKKFTALPWNSEQKRPVYICWSFGDGRDTCIQYPNTFPGPYTVVHLYQQPGSYEVCVKIVYQDGCEAKKCKVIVAGETCKADFEKLLYTAPNNPLLVYYKALPWNSNNKKPKTICWSFGDGRDTCIQYPENFTGVYVIKHRYREPGVFNVCIKILYYGGCEAGICKTIQVGRRDECKADFERLPYNTTNNPLVVYYKALPWNSNNRKPKQICWSFGDGKDTCIEYPSTFTGSYVVRHNYRETGRYEVCVKILYYGGCEARTCKVIYVVRPDVCGADFERLPLQGTDPLVVGFKAIPSHNNHKLPRVICWSFGDGKDTCVEYTQTFTGTYVIYHHYKEPGIYKVCIKILYYGGCEAYLCKEITVGEFCTADFERIPVNSTEHPLLVYYKALPWNSLDKKPKAICWSFGDGRDTCIDYSEDYTGQYVISHRYEKPGDNEVCIKILYFGGCEAKNCKIIKVEAIDECHVKLFELIPSINSLIRGFVAYPWSSDNKGPLRVCWYFGDGEDTCMEAYLNSTLPGLFIRHTYPAPGVYKACVKVVFDGGCVAYDCVEVVIKPTTDACGGYMTDSLVSLRTYKFKGYAIHNPGDPVVSFYWTFGDGSSAAGNEVTHTYNVPGTYEVCLTIKTYRGCETHICKKLAVPGEVHPVLQISPNPVVTTMHVLFLSAFTETVNIKIVNSFGVVVRTYVRNAVTGQNTWDFDVSALAAGTYTLYVQSSNQLSSLLFIKVN